MEIRKLNMLRGIAALIVVVSHYSNFTLLASGIPMFGNLLGWGSGNLGVMLFFMLSGFLMSFLYLNKPLTARNVKTFSAARIARVIPLFFVVVVISYVLPRLGVEGIAYNIPDVRSLLSHLLLLFGTSVLWTIPPEMHFYMLFLFFWWLHARHSAYLYLLIAILFTLLYLLDFPAPNFEIAGQHIYIMLIHTLPFFMIGTIFGQLYRNWEIPAGLRRHWFLLGILLILLLYPGIFIPVFGFSHRMWRDVGVMAIMALAFFCVVFLVPDDNALMSNVVGDFLGRISYSLYLLHLPLLMILLPVAKQAPLLFAPVFFAVVILVSWLSFLVIENPSRLWLRDRLIGAPPAA